MTEQRIIALKQEWHDGYGYTCDQTWVMLVMSTICRNKLNSIFISHMKEIRKHTHFNFNPDWEKQVQSKMSSEPIKLGHVLDAILDIVHHMNQYVEVKHEPHTPSLRFLVSYLTINDEHPVLI